MITEKKWILRYWRKVNDVTYPGVTTKPASFPAQISSEIAHESIFTLKGTQQKGFVYEESFEDWRNRKRRDIWQQRRLKTNPKKQQNRIIIKDDAGPWSVRYHEHKSTKHISWPVKKCVYVYIL